MKLESLTVRGFMTAFAGKQIAIDFSQMPDGLLAIVGDNGAGKTTLLEAAAAGVYREPMSRKGTLESYAMDRDSFIESRWAFGSQLYRTRVSIDGIKGGSTGAIATIRPDGSVIAKLNDGKVSSYDPVVADVFPPLHVFKASAFAAQNKAGSFVKASKSDRRDIMNAALNLDRLVDMSQAAKAAAAEFEKVRVQVKADIAALERETAHAEVGALELQLAAIERDGCAAAERLEQVDVAIAAAQLNLATRGDDVAAHAAAQLRVTHAADLVKAKETETSAHIEADRQADVAEGRESSQLTIDQTRRANAIAQRITAGLSAAKQELTTIADEARTKLADIDSRLQGNADIQAKKAEIENAVSALAALQPQLAALNAKADEHGQIHQRLTEEVAAAEQALSAFAKPEADLARAKVDASLLGSVPCGGNEGFAACQFLVNAAAAAAKIVDLEITVAGMVAAVQTRDRLTAAKKDALQTYWDTKASCGTTEKQINELTDTAKYADKLAASEARVKELQLQRAGVEQDRDRRRSEATERHAVDAQRLADERAALECEHDAAVAALRARIDSRRAAWRDRRDVLTAAENEARAAHEIAVKDLAALADGNKAAEQLRAEIARLQTDRDGALTAIATAKSDGATVGRRLEDLREKGARLIVIRGRLVRLDIELLEWQLLQRALDRDGLPALETDQAGPEISATTNLILQDCFDSRFSVELVTQVARADGKGSKDDITLLVTDNHTGDVRDISDLSGGEEVIVAEAFMNAIAIFVNVRSASPIETFFRDETTGALTKENTQRYVQMLRKVQAIAGVRQIVFISHDPDAYSLADAQIRVADGAVATVLPPYLAAA